jgi:hypothetical protein
MRNAALLTAALVFSACGNLTSTGGVKLIPTTSTAALSTATATASTSAIASIRVLLDRVDLAGANSDAMPDGCTNMGNMGGGSSYGQGASGASDVASGPYVLTLNGAGSGTGVDISDLPVATYTSLTLSVAPPATGASRSTALADFASSGSSVIVQGTWNGTAYTLSLPVSAVRTITGRVAVSVGTEVALNVSVDTSGWFTAADGTSLDPTVSANQSAIAANVAASLEKESITDATVSTATTASN